MTNNNDYVDPIFEADAPKFFDFNKIDDDGETDEADLWFENHFDENDIGEVIDENAADFKSHLKSLGVDFSTENRENVPPPPMSTDKYQRTPQKIKPLSPSRLLQNRIEVVEEISTVEIVKSVVQQNVNENRQPMRSLEIISATSLVVESSIIREETKNRQILPRRSSQIEKSHVIAAAANKPVSYQLNLQRMNRCASADRAKEKLTIPVTPTLLTAIRVRVGSKENLHQNDSQNDNHHAFKARPVPRKLLASPTIGLKKPKPKTPTKGVEPNFAVDKRLALRRSIRASKENIHADVEKVPKIVPKRPTEIPKITSVEPFSFQKKEDELIEKRKRLVEEFYKRESEKPNVQPFKAAPMPSQLPDKLPEKQAKSPTVTNPFSFLTDNIHLAYEKRLREKLELEEKARKQGAEFRAHRAEVLAKEPFKPKHEEHPALEVDEFNLETMKRAEDRKRFDDYLKDKDGEREAAMMERRAIEDKAAKEEIKQIRSNAVHKAQPIKKYKDVEVKPKFECTVPIPHQFNVDDRLEKRRNK